LPNKNFSQQLAKIKRILKAERNSVFRYDLVGDKKNYYMISLKICTHEKFSPSSSSAAAKFGPFDLF
jgi:hypothetical protein